MWILKNSKDFFRISSTPSFQQKSSLSIFHSFIQPYLTRNWKTDSLILSETPSFSKNINCIYKYLVLGRDKTYFVKEHSASDSKSKYSEDDIIKMLEFLVETILVAFAGKVFQQTVVIPIGTNCAPLLADIFLYSYEKEFIQSLLSRGKKEWASRFNFTYRYIDDVLSINNSEFENYLGQMYPA